MYSSGVRAARQICLIGHVYGRGVRRFKRCKMAKLKVSSFIVRIEFLGHDSSHEWKWGLWRKAAALMERRNEAVGTKVERKTLVHAILTDGKVGSGWSGNSWIGKNLEM